MPPKSDRTAKSPESTPPVPNQQKIPALPRQLRAVCPAANESRIRIRFVPPDVSCAGSTLDRLRATRFLHSGRYLPTGRRPRPACVHRCLQPAAPASIAALQSFGQALRGLCRRRFGHLRAALAVGHPTALVGSMKVCRHPVFRQRNHRRSGCIKTPSCQNAQPRDLSFLPSNRAGRKRRVWFCMTGDRRRKADEGSGRVWAS
jgi:hypothetical protein